MCGFTMLFAIIFYEAQVSVKVGKVYEVPLQTNETLLSNINIDVDEERIEGKAIEILRYLFEDQFNVDDYEVSVATIRGFNEIPCYSVYLYNTKTQFEGYSIEFEIESGNVIYIWNNEFQDLESHLDSNQMSEEKLEEVAESYLNKINMDEVNEFQLTQKIYLMTGIEFIYKNDKRSQKVSILIDPETANFIYYLREPYL